MIGGAVFTHVLAQAPKAVELVGRQHPSLLDYLPYAFPVAGILVCLGALVYFGVRAAAEHSSARSPSDRRLAKVARRMGLTRADIELLKRLARVHNNAEPASLLISAHAFRESAARFAEGVVTPNDRQRLEAIARALGCSVDDVWASDRAPRDRGARQGALSVARRQAGPPGERRLSA